jgi:hypothetical protein
LSHADYLQDCWNQANPDENDRTDDEIEACHTVDDRTHEVVSVYCSSAGAVVVSGDRLIHLTRT